MSGGFFLYALLAILPLALIVFLIVKSSQTSSNLQSIAEQLGATEISRNSYSGEFNSLRYSFWYHAGSKNNPSYLKISTDTHVKGDFVFSLEKSTHRFFKSVGISEELQTGDSDFDRSVYIESHSAALCKLILQDASVRQAIVKLLRGGVKKIHLKKGSICIDRTPYKLDLEKALADIEESLPLLELFHKALESASDEVGSFRQIGAAAKEVEKKVYIALGVFAAAGLLQFIFGVQMYKPLEMGGSFKYSLSYGIPLALFCIAMLIVRVKGSSSAHRVVLIGSALSISGALLLSWGALLYFNGALDSDEAQIYEVQVLRKRISTSKNSKNYYLILESWRPEWSQIEISTNSYLYRKVSAGRTKLQVFSRPGRFEYEWIENYKILN